MKIILRYYSGDYEKRIDFESTDMRVEQILEQARKELWDQIKPTVVLEQGDFSL